MALHRSFEETYDQLVTARFGYENVKKSIQTIVRVDPDRSELTDRERQNLTDARVHLDHVRGRMAQLRKALHPTSDDLAFESVFTVCPDSGEIVRVEHRTVVTLSGAPAPFRCPICEEETSVSDVIS